MSCQSQKLLSKISAEFESKCLKLFGTEMYMTSVQRVVSCHGVAGGTCGTSAGGGSFIGIFLPFPYNANHCFFGLMDDTVDGGLTQF